MFLNEGPQLVPDTSPIGRTDASDESYQTYRRESYQTRVLSRTDASPIRRTDASPFRCESYQTYRHVVDQMNARCHTNSPPTGPQVCPACVSCVAPRRCWNASAGCSRLGAGSTSAASSCHSNWPGPSPSTRVRWAGSPWISPMAQ